MKIEIWSDVVCPMCYIGKRKFETALAQFQFKNFVQIEWKSFELAPNLKPDSQTSMAQLLVQQKGFSLEQAASFNTLLCLVIILSMTTWRHAIDFFVSLPRQKRNLSIPFFICLCYSVWQAIFMQPGLFRYKYSYKESSGLFIFDFDRSVTCV